MQLFTHLLSSYLQGMGDFFSALPRGGNSFSLCFRGGYDCAPFLEKDWNMDIIWAFFLPRGEG